MKTATRAFLLFLTVSVVLVGCGYSTDPTNGGLYGNYGSYGTTTPSFQSIAQTIFAPYCTSCHNNITSYQALAGSPGWITPGNPGQSVLYQAVASGSMPQSGQRLNSTQVAAIYQWIQMGGQNN